MTLTPKSALSKFKSPSGLRARPLCVVWTVLPTYF
jgi:hypothetical protein